MTKLKRINLTVDDELLGLIEQYKKLNYGIPDATICRMLIYQALTQLHGLR